MTCTLARVLLDRHFTNISDKKQKNIPYNFLHDTKVPCSIPNLPYMFVGSSVSRKELLESFSECLLDHPCHRKHAMWIGFLNFCQVTVDSMRDTETFLSHHS